MPDTANHAVRDGDLRIVYVAGDLGLYKLFPDTGEIALMMPVDVGEKGYMVGYAALTRRIVPVPVNIEFVLTPIKPAGYGYTDARYVFRHYRPELGWRTFAPPIAGKDWGGVRAAPHAPNTWITWVSNGTDPAAAVFRSDDQGATWAPIPLAMPSGTTSVRIQYVGWSPHAPDFLWIACSPHTGVVSEHASINYGAPGTTLSLLTVTTHGTRHGGWLAAGVMENGTFYGRSIQGGGLVSSRVYKRVVVDTTGSYLTNVTTDTIVPGGSAVHNVPGSTVALLFADSAFPDGSNNIWRTANYIAGDIHDTGAVVGTNQAAVTADARVFIGGSNDQGVRELTNPLTAPVVVSAFGDGLPTQAIASDAQTRTAVAALSLRSVDSVFFVYADGVWNEFGVEAADVPRSWVRSTTVEVIVREAP